MSIETAEQAVKIFKGMGPTGRDVLTCVVETDTGRAFMASHGALKIGRECVVVTCAENGFATPKEEWLNVRGLVLRKVERQEIAALFSKRGCDPECLAHSTWYEVNVD